MKILILKKYFSIVFFILFIACEQKQPKLKHRNKSPENIPSTDKFETYDEGFIKSIIKEMYEYLFKGGKSLSERLKASNINPEEMESIIFHEKIFFLSVNLFIKAQAYSNPDKYQDTNFKLYKEIVNKGFILENIPFEQMDKYSFMGYMKKLTSLITRKLLTEDEIENQKKKSLSFIKRIYTFYEKIKEKYPTA